MNLKSCTFNVILYNIPPLYTFSETTASTVFTFIDREKTAKAHDTETTDTALANLYAYIVSLPESSRKKKLIHKFNKENGKGRYYFVKYIMISVTIFLQKVYWIFFGFFKKKYLTPEGPKEPNSP